VHETLSQTYEEEVEFDAVADQLLALVSEVGGHEGAVRLRRTGSFGTIGSDVATPLAMVLTEVLQNAMEHGFAEGGSGTVEVTARDSGAGLAVRITDDGVGLPEGFDPEGTSSLGLSIVRTLVRELGGTLRITRRADEAGEHGPGTVVELTIPRRAP
jgi:two-component sensor histidine kinase